MNDPVPSEEGSVTVEAAVSLATLAVVLAACLAALACLLAQLRVSDAAREAARLAGRGDEGAARRAAVALAPGGASVEIGRDGDLVSATVTVDALGGLLPGITLHAQAIAAREPSP